MYFLSIILILIALQVEMQPQTIQYRLWFPCRISMDTAGGIWNKSQHIIACRLQTHVLIFLSLSHYIVVAVYEWFCIIHASYSLAVTVDLQMTQMQSLTGNLEPQWREVGCERKCKWSLTESNPPATCFASKCQYLGPFLSSEGICQLSEKRKPFSKSKSTIKVLSWPPSYTLPAVFHLDFHV